MAQIHTITVDYGCPTEVVYVVGTQLNINLYRTAPPIAQYFSVECSPNVDYWLHMGRPWGGLWPPTIAMEQSDNYWLPRGLPQPLKNDSVLHLSMSSASKQQGDGKVQIQLFDQEFQPLVTADLLLTAFEISLDVDADQDGVVEKNNPNKASWKWGPNGHGAILLVNCDSDFGKRPDNEERAVYVEDDLKDMALMLLRTAGPEQLPKGYRLNLHMSAPDAEGARVFKKDTGPESKDTPYPLLLDSRKPSRGINYAKETTFYVMGVKFADKDFDGLIQIHVSLLQPGEPETPVFIDTVQFKVAPWIMTPNVQTPLQVFVCSMSDNKEFLKGMTDLVETATGEKPYVVKTTLSGGDRWMQDEIEFGYSQAPYHSFPVVLESPRHRELAGFAYNVLLAKDFGYWTVNPPEKEVTSLESFGNLEVSPPVTVKGKRYPLGRILIGGSFTFQADGRHMTNAIKNFLSAQVVQEPLILFTDWLTVGHVDEFMTFVPAPGRKGFRLLLGSPHAAYKLLLGLKEAGHGQAKFFEDVPDMKKVTVDEVLADKDLHSKNDYYQRCIDFNRDRMKNELGLDEEDIVDIPLLYKPAEQPAEPWEKMKGAHTFYPNLVNMIVLGQYLGIAKPFGPKVDGQCAIEQEVTKLLGNVGLKCKFINDIVYYNDFGDVHCGSNVRRKPFQFKWWKMEM